MKTIMDLITEYIDNIGNGYPIFTSDIHDYVLNEIEDAKPLVINEYINRYEKNNNNFVRYKKGIYSQGSEYLGYNTRCVSYSKEWWRSFLRKWRKYFSVKSRNFAV